MGTSDTDEMEHPEDAILVEATLEQLKRAAARVLFEFKEMYESRNGEPMEPHGDLLLGEAVVFEEEMDHCPAQIVAIKISETYWYIISTSEDPPSGYPTTKDAVKAAQAEEKKLRIIIEFLAREEGTKLVEDVRSWKPDMKAEMTDVLGIIRKGRKKWVH